MRLQFISEGSQDSPLILITCNRAQAVAAFSEALPRSASGPIELHRLPGVDVVDYCASLRGLVTGTSA